MVRRTANLRAGGLLANVLLLAGGAVACAHSHATPGAAPISTRERRAVIGDGAVVTATRWDDTLVELTVAEVPGPGGAALRERLRARHRAGASFTVVVELADRPLDGDVLADGDAWWFRCGELRPTRVELVAVDRHPTGDGRAHVRMGFDVGFAAAKGGCNTLQVGSAAARSRRPELGRHVARHGAPLRW